MRKLIFVLSYFFISVVYANETVIVTVSEKIAGRVDNEVRQSARLKAKWEALLKLPVMVAGEQQMADGNFSEQITAIGINFVDVKAINEIWDRKGDVLRLKAAVTADTEKALNRLQSIKNNLNAKRRLNTLYHSLDKLFANSLLTQEDRASFSLLTSQIKLEPFFKKTAAETIFFKNKLIRDIATKINTEMLSSFAKKVNITIVDVSFDAINIEIELDENTHPSRCYAEKNRASCGMDTLLGSTLTADFFYHYKKQILSRVGRLCMLKYAYVPTYGDSLDRSANYRNYESFIPVKTNFDSLPELAFSNQYENHVVKRMIKENSVYIRDGNSNTITFEFDPIDDVLENPDAFLEIAVCVPKLNSKALY